MPSLFTTESSHEPLANYLRFHRKRIGLNQEELGKILGYRNEGQVSRHERLGSLPPLLIALGYEAVFRVPLSEIFPGLRDAVEQGIETRLAAFEEELQQHSGKGRSAPIIAHKLEWLTEWRTMGRK